MSNGIIDIKQNEMDEIKAYLNKSATHIMNSSSKIASSFSSFTKVGLFSDGANKIQRQMSGISSGISNMENAISKQNDKMIDIERNLSIKANDIQISLDFVTNDNAYEIAMSKDSLSKNDGKKINAKNENNEKELDLQNSKEFNLNLKEFVKDYEEKNGEIVLNANTITLNNIKNDKDSSIDDSEEDSIIKKKIISALHTEISEKIPNIDLSLNFGKINLIGTKISNLDNVEFDEAYKLFKQELSEMLYKGNYKLVNYKDE